MTDDATKPPTPDSALVVRARRGDAEATNELVRRHHASVFRVALGVLQDWDQAADVAQESFVRALRGLRRFRGDASFRTWILAIAANQARSHRRRWGRRRENSLDWTTEVPSPNPDPAELAVAAERAERLRRGIGQLPRKQRLSVQLRVFEGLSFREVGQVIGSSEAAARVNYHHGVQRLKELLGDE